MRKKALVIFLISAGMVFIMFPSCKKKTSPSACFTVTADSILTGRADTFTNCSTNAILYYWYFGDGDSDYVNQSPVHSYAKPGTYSVQLIAKDNTNKTDTKIQQVTALPPVTSASFIGTYSGTQSCSPSGSSTSQIVITANGYLNLYISNLYGTGKNFKASISDSTATITPQLFYNGSENLLLQGSISFAPIGLFVNLIVTGVGKREECQVQYIKQ